MLMLMLLGWGGAALLAVAGSTGKGRIRTCESESRLRLQLRQPGSAPTQQQQQRQQEQGERGDRSTLPQRVAQAACALCSPLPVSLAALTLSIWALRGSSVTRRTTLHMHAYEYMRTVYGSSSSHSQVLS